jgi:hypothetical protein
VCRTSGRLITSVSLEGGDVLAAPADHVLDAVEEVEVPLLVLRELVARVEPAVAPGLRRRLRHVLVAGVDHPGERVARDELARRAGRHGEIVLVDEPELVVHRVRRPAAALLVVRVQARDDGDRHLGHPVRRVDGHAEPLGELLVMRERPHVHGLQRIVRVVGRGRLVEHERRHAVDGDRDRRLEAPHVVPEAARAEALVERHGSPGSEHRIGDAGAGGVEHRQRVEVAVVLGE